MTATNPTFNKTLSEKEKTAAAWCIKLDVEQNATDSELIEFVEWLRADPVHELLYERCKFTWGLTSEIEDDPEIAGYIDEILVEPKATGKDWKSLVSFSSMPAIAAGLLVAVLIGFFAVTYDPGETLPGIRYHTAIGEQRSFELDDGSNVFLNTSTELLVKYDAETRRIILLNGEALFDVVHDPVRPFIVEAGGGAVRALGTRFSVRKGVSEVTVLLAEGSVKIEPAVNRQSSAGRNRVLMPGEQVIYSSDGKISEAMKVDVAQALQWSVGKLTFSDARLVDVVAEVNRYTPIKIIIEDPAIQEEKISAYFFVENIDSLLFALDSTFNIEARKNSGKIYLLRKQQSEH